MPPSDASSPSTRHVTPDDLRAALRDRFGHPDFRPGQARLIRAVLGGGDALGVLPTGGGKSVCYMLPAGLLPGLTVVVSPLVSLMADQAERARDAGLAAACLTSTLPAPARREVLERLREGALDLLLVAPERFRVGSFRRALEGVPVSLLAVDEAHCIAQWGHDFRPSYLGLGAIRASLRAPCMALTATATPAVRDEIVRVLGLRGPARVVGSFDRPNLRWEVHRLSDEGARRASAAALVRRRVRSGSGATVVYVATRRDAETARDGLAALGLPAETYHAGMRPEARERVQAAFMAGEAPVVVATNAFGMGVDKPDVRLVLHLGASGSLEAYYQEAGRAGRDGEPAGCVVLHVDGDQALHRSFLDRSRPRVRVARALLAALRGSLGADGRGEVRPCQLAAGLGRGWSVERVEAGLRFLAGAGLLRLTDGASGGGTPDGGAVSSEVRVSLRPGRPDFRRARRLRRAGAERLGAVRRYVRGRGCRRRLLLAYFGEEAPPGPCGRCDRCGAALYRPPGRG